MIYELRIYRCVSGRMPDLLKRFETKTLQIWQKYGIRQAGFWTVMIGPCNQDLYYMLEWDSLAEREKRWSPFIVDPEWLAAKTESERDGALIETVENMILQPTAFSSVR